MRQALLLLVVFLVAFAATLLLTREGLLRRAPVDEGASPAGQSPVDEDVLAAKRRAEITRTMIPKDRPADAEVAVDAGPSAAPGIGEIEGVTKTDDGLEPRGLSVHVLPAAAEPILTGGGRFLVPGLPPGVYHVGVAAEGYVSRPPVEVAVQAGRRHKVEVGLERGFELRGIVLEDVDQRPIQGAVIDFNGLASAVSDAFGAFRTGVVHPRALDLVTITHDDYERNRMIHPVIPEPGNIVLAMSRGRATVTGRVVAPTDASIPSQFIVRLWRVAMPGHEELRRERSFRDTATFEIKGVFGGTHVVEVTFPGTTLVSRRVEFDLGADPTRHIEIDLNQGGAVEGLYATSTGVLAGHPMELVDLANHKLGEARTDGEGRFRFDRVPAGEYAIRMMARIPPLHTQAFIVEVGRVARITVDGQTGRLR